MRSLLYSTRVRPRGVCVSASGWFYFEFCLLGSLPSHPSGFHSKVLTVSYFECVLSPYSWLIPHLSCRGRCYTHTRVQLLPWLTGFLAFGCIPNELLILDALGSFFSPMHDETLHGALVSSPTHSAGYWRLSFQLGTSHFPSPEISSLSGSFLWLSLYILECLLFR